MATIERLNTLEMFGHIISIAISGVQPGDKQKLVRTLEEVWVPGLREHRELANKEENEALIELTKKTFRVAVRGDDVVGGFVDKKKPPKSS